MSSKHHSAGELEIRLRQACAEVDRRIRDGETDVARDFLASQPEFASNEDLAIELIYAEFVTLEELGVEPSPQETFARFPQFRSRLERLFQVHSVLRGDADLEIDRMSETLAKFDSTYGGDLRRTNVSDGPATRHLAEYELLEEVARGGMGIVYKARQIGLDRIVAIKVIRSSDASDVERSRFRTEAEAAAKLQHPNTVQIFDVGQNEGLDYLCMEYVSGGSLEQRLEGERPSIHAAAQLIATIAEAAEFAHRRGIIHRDLKPGNILLDGEVPKIGDFGLAKRMLEDIDAQTQTGDVLGTPSYMSPEQAEGKTDAIGPWSDIYSLGAILYEMLSGRPPFVGDTPLATIDLIRSQDPDPPSSIEPKVPRDLDTICLKCLSKEPARRYASAQDLADDLNRFLDHQPISARRVGFLERSWRWAHRRPAVSGLAATLLIVSLAGGVVVALQHRYVGELSKSANATKRRVAVISQRAEEATVEAVDNLQAAKQAIERLSILGSALYHEPGMSKTALQTAQQALDQYQNLLEKNGDDDAMRLEAARVFTNVGYIQLEVGKWHEAEKTLSQAVNLYDTLDNSMLVTFERAGTQIQLAHSKRNLGKWSESVTSYDAAIDQLERLNQSNPTNNAFAARLANALVNQSLLFKREQPEQVTLVYCQAIRLQRGIIERTAGFAHANSIEPNEGDLQQVTASEIIAAESLRQRVVAEGSKLLPKIVAAGQFTELSLSLDDLGMLLRKTGSPDLAELAIREALELRRLSVSQVQGVNWRQLLLARSHTNVGRLEFDRREYDRAAKSYEAARSLLKGLSEAFPHRRPYERQLGRAYTNLGLALHYCRHFEDAQANHREAVEIHERLANQNPTLPRATYDLGRSTYYLAHTLRAMDKSNEAIPLFERALQLAPRYDRAFNELAWTLLMDSDHALRNPQQALPLAKRAVALDPHSGAYRNTLGVAQFRNGDDAQAIETLKEAIELNDGGDGFDWFFLAMAHKRQGDIDTAAEWLERSQSWYQSQNSPSEELRQIKAEADEVFNQ